MKYVGSSFYIFERSGGKTKRGDLVVVTVVTLIFCVAIIGLAIWASVLVLIH